MKTVTLKQEVKDKLDKFADGKSVNKAMRLLLKDVEKIDNPKKCNKQKYYNIKIDDDLFDKLKKCKIHTKESHSDTIERLLSEKMKK